MNTFSDILRDLIADERVSLRKLSERSNVAAIQYSRYIRGSYPTIDVAVRIANYFHCSLDYLFGLVDDRQYVESSDYNMNVFVSRYMAALKLNNITHWKFAKLYNISESNLRHWKYGEIPKIETLINIAKNLDCSIDYLIGRSDTM